MNFPRLGWPGAIALGLACFAFYGCAAPSDIAINQTSKQSEPSLQLAVDDGSYLSHIDPLGGQWRVTRLGDSDFTQFNGWVNFSAGGFINHGAGCAGGYPAFYRLDGDRVTVTRLEQVRIGKCAGKGRLANAPATLRQAAADSERQLASFIDQLSGWSRDGETLILTRRDGGRAILTKPVEPHPELAGRWLIETIGGKPLLTERRPAMLSIAMGALGASADCNSMGGQFTVPAPGRILVAGPIVSTAIGCAPEDAAEDAQMIAAIQAASAYRLVGDRLIFTGGPGIIARRPAPPDLRLTGEFEACGNTLLGAYHEGPITLAISPKAMRDNAGCTASYAADGPELALRLDDSPGCSAAAPAFVPGKPIGVGGDKSMLSLTRPNGFGFNAEGLLILRTNRGLLTMCRKGLPLPFGS